MRDPRYEFPVKYPETFGDYDMISLGLDYVDHYRQAVLEGLLDRGMDVRRITRNILITERFDIHFHYLDIQVIRRDNHKIEYEKSTRCYSGYNFFKRNVDDIVDVVYNRV
jgi:hypothetical protein